MTDPPATQSPMTVVVFDAADPVVALDRLTPCCASTRWAEALVTGRPYGDLAALARGSDDLVRELDAADLRQALAAHPRIGDRVRGDDTESTWSRQEQSATADLAATVAEQLVAANLAYESRFGQVFLICATGKSATQMLSAARTRLENTPDVEREVVRRELAAIVRLRLAKVLT